MTHTQHHITHREHDTHTGTAPHDTDNNTTHTVHDTHTAPHDTNRTI